MQSFYKILKAALLASSLAVVCSCDRRTPDERLATAMQFYQQGDFTSAEMEALKVLEKAPEDPASIQASQLLAQVYRQQNMTEEAALQLESALDKVSQKEQVGKELLMSYVDLLNSEQKYDDSLKLVEKYQNEYKEDAGTSLSLRILGAHIRTQAGRTTEARTILQDQMDQTTDPMEMKIYRELYFTTLQRDSNTTAAIAYKLDELNQETDAQAKASIKVTLSSLYAANNDYAQARSYLENVTTQMNEALGKELDKRARIGMALQFAQMYEEVGNVPGARRIYQELYEVARTDKALIMPVQMGMVNVLMREGDTSATESFLKELAATFPEQQFKTQLENFQKMSASGELARIAQPDTSPVVMQYRQDANILWPADLPALISGGASTTGTAAARPEATPAGTAVETTVTQPASVSEEATTSSSEETTSPQ